MPTPDEIAAGGGSGGGGSVFGSGFLWKPYADHSGNLVILTPEGVNAKSVKVNGQETNYTGRANGNRQHWRLGVPGSSFSGGATVEVTLEDGSTYSWKNPNGALRYENGSTQGKPALPGGAGGAGGLAGGGAGLVNAEPGPNQTFMQDLFRSVFQPYDPSGGVGGAAAGPKSFTFQDLADSVLGVASDYDTTAGWLRGLEPGKEFSSIDELKAALPGLDTSNIPARYQADAQGVIDQAFGNLASGKTAGGTLPQDNIVTSALQNLIAGNLSPSPHDPFGNVLQGAFMKSLGLSGPGEGATSTIGDNAALTFANMSAGPMGTSRAVPGSPFAGLGALAGLQGGGSAMPTNSFNPFNLPGMSSQNPMSQQPWQWPTQQQSGGMPNLGGPIAGYDPSSFFQPVPQTQPRQPGQERGFGSLLLGPNQGKFMTNPNVNTPQGMSRLWDPGNLSSQQSGFLQQNGLGSMFPGGGGMGGGGGGFGGGGGGFGGSGGFGFFGPTNNVAPGILPSYVQGQVPSAIQGAFDTNLSRALAEITESFGAGGARFGTDLADQLGTTAGNANVQLMADAAQRATDAYNALTQNALGFGNLGLGFQNSAINRELGLGQLDLNRFLGAGRLGNESRGLDIQQQLGLGNLGMDQQRLQAQTQLGALNQLLGLGGQLSQQDFLGGQGSLDRALQEYLGQIQRPDPLLDFLGGFGF